MSSVVPQPVPPSVPPSPSVRAEWESLDAEPSLLEVGDVVHVRGKGFISRAIRWFSRAVGEDRTWASHTAVVLRVDTQADLIEAIDLKDVAVRRITVYRGTGSRLLVTRRPGGLTQPEKDALAAKLLDYKGRKYGTLKIVLHALDRMLNNAYFFRRLSGDRYPICSWLVAFAYDRVLGYRFGCEPDAAQPDDILDHCMEGGWRLVWVDSLDSLASLRVVYARRGRDLTATPTGSTARSLPIQTRDDVESILSRNAPRKP